MYEVLPQGGWVVFEEIKDDDLQKQGAIFLPNANTDELPMKKGKVLILGPEAALETKAQVGDIVLYHKKIGIPFILNGKKIFITKGENFYCIMKEVKEEVVEKTPGVIETEEVS